MHCTKQFCWMNIVSIVFVCTETTKILLEERLALLNQIKVLLNEVIESNNYTFPPNLKDDAQMSLMDVTIAKKSLLIPNVNMTGIYNTVRRTLQKLLDSTRNAKINDSLDNLEKRLVYFINN
ncbi:hypothetical protein D915_004800 [Fasciola hepatica]|uniref:Uncharacterized protein n=1 Tax=Fasciola hepatica TaxID=6192 RepID=A0A4E0RZ86_FASHE|nr:hypothetical protein D915_004800 [Fasciola hepatica]